MLKSLGLILSASLAAHASSGVHFDPPDLNLEYQLHSQYLRAGSHGENGQAPTGIIESYQLQQGENLWGLSQMLYGDGNYWPKVWAQNKSITNPHLIRPGHTLHFQMGSEDDTPSFRFSEAEEPGLELAAANSTPQIEVPPPETPPRPIIQVPKSFPEWQSVFKKGPDHFEIDSSKMLIKRYVPPDKIPLTAFVQEHELDASGTFLEIEKESGLPMPNQYVYVKIKKGTGQIGQKYMIVKDMGKIRKLNDQVEGDINARFIQVFGDLELTDTAPATFSRSRDRENYEAFRGRILHAISLTMTDYTLIPGTMSIVDMSTNGPEGTAQAQLIGSTKHLSSALYGIGDIVFLNKGSKDSVAEGQIYDIYIDRTIRDEETPIKFSTVSSGKIKIAKVTDTLATAVILRAVDSIQQGDRVQSKMAQVSSAPPVDDGKPASSGPPSEFDLPPGDSPAGSAPPADGAVEPATDFDLPSE